MRRSTGRKPFSGPCPAKPGRLLGHARVSTEDQVTDVARQRIVMRDGKVVESRPALELLAKPRSAYTRALFAAAFDIKAEGAALNQ